MNFQDALKNLLEGKKVRRKSWGNGLYLIYGQRCKLFIDGDNGNEPRCLSTDEHFSIDDVLTEDWEVIE